MKLIKKLYNDFDRDVKIKNFMIDTANIFKGKYNPTQWWNT